jgi:hypothetical protein
MPAPDARRTGMQTTDPERAPLPSWRNALLIFLGLLLLAFIAAVVIRFAFTPYEFIDNLPHEVPEGSR